MVPGLLTGPRWRIGLRDLDASAVGLGGWSGVVRHGSPEEQARAGAAAGADEAEVGALSDVLERLDDPELRSLRSAVGRGRAGGCTGCAASSPCYAGGSHQALPDLIADVERTIGLDVELEATPERLRRGRRANVLAFLDVASDRRAEGQTARPWRFSRFARSRRAGRGRL